MHFKFRLSVAAVVAAFSIGQAQAADPVVEAPVEVPVAAPAGAQWEIGVYTGGSFTHDSDVKYSPSGLPNETFDVSWDGKPFEMPPYYGVRITRWFETMPEWGIQFDYNHIKTYADLDGEVGDTFDTLEFTDGLNIVTLNGVYRWQNSSRFTPYVGAGLGVNVPHVEVEEPGVTDTFEYQLGGVAANGFVGVDYALTDRFSIFGEYKLSYAHVIADLEGGGELSTHFVNHHVNVGLAFKFDAF